jgi:hypothetical protein
MNQLDAIIDRFRTLPRAMQWALLAAIGLVVFLIWSEGVVPIIDRWDRQATAIEGKLIKVRESKKIKDELVAMQPFVTAVGPVQRPGNEAEGSSDLQSVINGVLQNFAVSDQQLGLSLRSYLPKTALTGLSGNRRIQKLTGDLKFTAAQDVAVAVIAAFESSPDIEQVNSVRLTKDGGGKVKVHITLEAWVIEGLKAGSA